MDLLVATKNPGKFKEISQFLQMPHLKLFSLRDFPGVTDPVENGKTFQENAMIKARYYGEKFKIAALADDGGLEIDVFGGAPGVISRRWLDGVHEATDEELINYCLKKMKGIKDRKARLTACLYLYSMRGTRASLPLQIYAQESAHGIIAEKPSATRFPGFPFRSLLWIPEIKKFYNEDELTEEETKKYNHRYKAIQKIKRQLKLCC